jgi:hypothetical protein
MWHIQKWMGKENQQAFLYQVLLVLVPGMCLFRFGGQSLSLATSESAPQFHSYSNTAGEQQLQRCS